MPLGKDRKELEEVLRDNMVTAYIDYAMEFGKIKANKVINETSKLLNKNGRLKG